MTERQTLTTLHSLSNDRLLTTIQKSADNLRRERVLLAYGLLEARTRGEDVYMQAVSQCGLVEKTCRNYAATAACVPIEAVPEGAHLSWLSEVKGLSTEDQTRILGLAAAGGWTADDIRNLAICPKLGKTWDEAKAEFWSLLTRRVFPELDKLLLQAPNPARSALQTVKNVLSDLKGL
jgi:hypothetical protein